jgi:hypothetical protein
MIRLYVDGTEEASTPATYATGFGSATAALNIGWIDLSLGYHLNGSADDIAIYSRALSPDEISRHRNEGLVGRGHCEPYAPIYISTPVTNAVVEWLYTYDAETVAKPAPTYALVTYPSGMTINPTTGLISWTPTGAQEGAHNVIVQASNTEGSSNQPFVVTVAGPLEVHLPIVRKP